MSVLKPGEDIVLTDLVQFFMLTHIYGKAVSSFEHAGVLSECVYIIHVYKDAAVYLHKTAVIIQKRKHI